MKLRFYLPSFISGFSPPAPIEDWDGDVRAAFPHAPADQQFWVWPSGATLYDVTEYDTIMLRDPGKGSYVQGFVYPAGALRYDERPETERRLTAVEDEDSGVP